VVGATSDLGNVARAGDLSWRGFFLGGLPIGVIIKSFLPFGVLLHVKYMYIRRVYATPLDQKSTRVNEP
jgi:hypothetical protein